MRTLIIALTIMLVIIVGIFSGIAFLNEYTDSFNNDLELARSSYNEGNYQEASLYLDKLSRSMSESENILCVMINHVEISKIGISLSKLKVYVNCEVPEYFNAECEALKITISSISLSEKLTFANLF